VAVRFRSYLDWLTAIPWGEYTVDELNIQKATEVLDKDHFGLGESRLLHGLHTFQICI
jgi:ATP-dependent Lon protease